MSVIYNTDDTDTHLPRQNAGPIAAPFAPSGSGRKWLIIAVVIIILVGAGVGGWLVLRGHGSAPAYFNHFESGVIMQHRS